MAYSQTHCFDKLNKTRCQRLALGQPFDLKDLQRLVGCRTVVYLYTTVYRPPSSELQVLFPAKILGQQEEGTKTTKLTTFPLPCA